ncbi:hypothetical protein TrST_g10164 [Triparma strigata]|uniref:Uncharacterized protein n=1 Tax=Triparma strigata TaxID=1606541 RepID=A0A9W6ZK10_9STRA|nr:hypothetical protein TrST_g10164 [Triparma strigata]
MVCMYLRLADENLCILLSSMQIADVHARAKVHPKSTSKSPQSKETRQNIYNKALSTHKSYYNYLQTLLAKINTSKPPTDSTPQSTPNPLPPNKLSTLFISAGITRCYFETLTSTTTTNPLTTLTPYIVSSALALPTSPPQKDPNLSTCLLTLQTSLLPNPLTLLSLLVFLDHVDGEGCETLNDYAVENAGGGGGGGEKRFYFDGRTLRAEGREGREIRKDILNVVYEQGVKRGNFIKAKEAAEKMVSESSGPDKIQWTLKLACAHLSLHNHHQATSLLSSLSASISSFSLTSFDVRTLSAMRLCYASLLLDSNLQKPSPSNLKKITTSTENQPSQILDNLSLKNSRLKSTLLMNESLTLLPSNPSEAIRRLQKLSSLNNFTATFNLTLAFVKVGRVEEAVKTWLEVRGLGKVWRARKAKVIKRAREEAVSRFVEIKGGGGTEQVREGVEVVEGGGRVSWEQITMMDMVVLKLALKQLSGSISLKNSLR